jgi:uncharacterized iron-regulated membrane protein
MDPSIKDPNCAEWCCVSHSATAFWLVVFFCAAVFLSATGYYLRRLHQVNVKSGAIPASKASGSKPTGSGSNTQTVDYR